MDEERRQKEKYRSRFIRDHEVPDWENSKHDPKDSKGKGFNYESANNIENGLFMRIHLVKQGCGNR